MTSIAYDGGTVPLGPYCWGTGGQLATQLKTWLQGAGYTVSNVTYVSSGRDIGQVKILGTNFPLSQVNLCIACLTSQDEVCPKRGQITFSSTLSCLGTVEKRNQEIRPCKFPPGTNPGTDAQQPGSILDLDDLIDTSTPATVPLPNVLYKIKLLDGSIRWVFKTELGTIKGQYTRLTEIVVSSTSQVFTIKKTNGQTIQTDLAGLLNERKLGTIDDI